jgi:hypothetical protein
MPQLWCVQRYNLEETVRDANKGLTNAVYWTALVIYICKLGGLSVLDFKNPPREMSNPAWIFKFPQCHDRLPYQNRAAPAC